jgi:hypothetical protein
MDLKDSLRRERARGLGKTPLPPSLFSHVGGLVRRHRLGETFHRLLASMTPKGAETLARACRMEAKPRYEAPLFFLATPEEYQVIQQILAELDNPYLAWARSPEEILLSLPLWQRRPGLDQETLAHRHFAALW